MRSRTALPTALLAAALLGVAAPGSNAATRSNHALRVSSHVGGSSVDFAETAAVDAAGNLYVAGHTSSADFPTTSGAYQTEFQGDHASSLYDVFVTKVDPSGSEVVYSTYLGGAHRDMVFDIDVDAAGAAYLTGTTSSSDWPTTPGALHNLTRSAENVFVTKLSPDGSELEYSAILGPGTAAGIDVDDGGHAHVSGQSRSSNYPTTSGAVQPGPRGHGDAFVSKVEPDGGGLVYSTFLGGTDVERPGRHAVDDGGRVVVAGVTASHDFPVTRGAFQERPRGRQYTSDVFVTKLSADGSELVYSTYIGGSEFEWSASAAVAASGAAFVVGTTSSLDFPTTRGAFQRTKQSRGDGQDAFVVKLDPSGSRRYATFLGGARSDGASGVAVAGRGAVYVAGTSLSDDFPTTPGALKRRPVNNNDAFLTLLDPRGRTVTYSTLYGGRGQYELGNDVYVGAGRVALAGPSYGPDLPRANEPFQRDYGLGGDSYLAAFAATPAVGTDLVRGGFEDSRLKLRLGETVQWHFASKVSRAVRDAGDTDLFDSGTRPKEFHYAFTFFAAGRFFATDTATGDRQRLTVPMLAVPSAAVIELTWATEVREGYVFDVQVRRPGADAWETLHEGTTETGADFEPDGSGAYRFRARLRHDATGGHSGWSPPASVAI
ncbi:MAG TPA: hypothetical protein VHJ76_06050 [Actinomycetota bacterium]|nr:hypothetical protein [Actinomycetota bacterium]